MEKVPLNLLVLGDFLRNFFKHKFSLSYLGKFFIKFFNFSKSFWWNFCWICEVSFAKSSSNSPFLQPYFKPCRKNCTEKDISNFRFNISVINDAYFPQFFLILSSLTFLMLGRKNKNFIKKISVVPVFCFYFA
jgi:hypothetical protein